MDELFSLILIGGFLLAIAVVGIYFSWRARSQSHDLLKESKAREKTRERLWKADVLNASVAPDDEAELLANWFAELRRFQVSAVSTVFAGVICGGFIAGAFLLLGVPMFWAVWPVLIATVAGCIGGLALALGRKERRAITQASDAVPTDVNAFRPRFVFIVGCVMTGYCALVSLVIALRVVPLGPRYDNTDNIAPLLKTPTLVLAAPLAALALLVLVEICIRLVMASAPSVFSHDAGLQDRAKRQWLGERVGTFAMMEGGILPLFVALYLGDLSRPFAFPLPGAVTGVPLFFAVVCMPWGFAASLRYIA